MNTQQLIDQVIAQIERDISVGDYTAIEELLLHCPIEYLEGFLSEEC